jgi:hypothetical protein
MSKVLASPPGKRMTPYIDLDSELGGGKNLEELEDIALDRES